MSSCSLAGNVSTLPPLIAGRYLAKQLLGRGGMGIVYVAEHVHTGERLALKVLSAQAVNSPAALDRFRREARAPAQIKSEHVVRVIDADFSAEVGAFFLVMELLDGKNLDQLTDGEPQPPEVVVRWMRQVARGLDKAHRLGIVHRDLKPENLFLTTREDGSELLKLLDFGVAKFVAEAASGSGNSTETGNVVGTPRYMAPEQAKGEVNKIGPHTDVWALGLIAYRLLSGRDFFTGTTLAQLIGQIVYSTIPLPSETGAGCGPAFDQWFLRSCAREPGERFSNVVEQVNELATALVGVRPELLKSTLDRMGSAETVAFTPAGSIPPPGPGAGSLGGSASAARREPTAAPRSRRPLLLLLLAGAAGLGVAAFFWPRSPTEPVPERAESTPSSRVAASEDPPVVTSPASPSAAPIVEAQPDAGVDAGRRIRKSGTRTDPLREQY